MSAEQEPCVEYLFNTATGELLVGQAAVGQHIEIGGDPSDLTPLKDLLESRDKIDGSYPRLDARDWPVNHYVDLGKWLLDVTDPPLRSRMLFRAYELGIGPDPQRIYRPERGSKLPRFNNFGEFYDAIGAQGVRRKGRYSDWSFTRTMKYIDENAQEAVTTGIRPTVAYFHNLWEAGNGPSVEVMQKGTGNSVGRLLDMAGWPEVMHWDEERYIDWGVKFTLANGRLPYYEGIRILSAKRRGPSHPSIHRNFGGIKPYKKLVKDAVDLELIRREKEHTQKIAEIDENLNSGALPLDAVIHDLPATELLRIIAQYKIATKLLPNATPHTKREIATSKKPNTFVKRLQEIEPHLSEARIEIAADSLGVFSDIWPFDDYLDYLKVA